jgi:hypothetical protein
VPVGDVLPPPAADVQAQLVQLQRAVATLAQQQAASQLCLLCLPPAYLPADYLVITLGRRPSSSRCSRSCFR